MGTVTAKQPTHIQARRDAAERCMKRVCWLMEWSEEQYCWYKYNTGMTYLQVYLKGDAHAMSILERSAIFWGWWKNHWTIREEEFVSHTEHLSRISLRTRKKAYKALHNANALAAELHDDARRMGDSYAKMIPLIANENK